MLKPKFKIKKVCIGRLCLTEDCTLYLLLVAIKISKLKYSGFEMASSAVFHLESLAFAAKEFFYFYYIVNILIYILNISYAFCSYGNEHVNLVCLLAMCLKLKQVLILLFLNSSLVYLKFSYQKYRNHQFPRTPSCVASQEI